MRVKGCIVGIIETSEYGLYGLPEADHQNQNGPVSCEDDPFAPGSD